jgi:hypothetical protein
MRLRTYWWMQCCRTHCPMFTTPCKVRSRVGEGAAHPASSHRSRRPRLHHWAFIVCLHQMAMPPLPLQVPQFARSPPWLRPKSL